MNLTSVFCLIRFHSRATECNETYSSERELPRYRWVSDLSINRPWIFTIVSLTELKATVSELSGGGKGRIMEEQIMDFS